MLKKIATYSLLACCVTLLGCGQKSAEKDIASIKILPPMLTLAKGEKTELVVEATLKEGAKIVLKGDATWASAMPSIASINSTGQLSALTEGTTKVSATINNGHKTLISTIDVHVAKDLTIKLPVEIAFTEEPIQLQAYFTNGAGEQIDYTSKVTWSNSDSTIATIDKSGLFTGISQGDTTVKAVLIGTPDAYLGTLDITVLSQAEAKKLHLQQP